MPRVFGMLRDEALGGGDHGGEAALHVGGAATVQDAVADDRLERIGLPLLARSGRHDIGMTGEAQHRPPLPCRAQRFSTGPNGMRSTRKPSASRRCAMSCRQP